MKQAKIGQLKDSLSRYLDFVRAGGEVLVLDRDRPVARLVPVGRAGGAPGPDEERLARLERQGLLRRGVGDPAEWLDRLRPVKLGRSLVADVLAEREEGW
ncbi:MAG: type II toxin-antitoxin system Phd/YefM family antitoxin [Thermoanaerobaculia bacterium]